MSKLQEVFDLSLGGSQALKNSIPVLFCQRSGFWITDIFTHTQVPVRKEAILSAMYKYFKKA